MRNWKDARERGRPGGGAHPGGDPSMEPVPDGSPPVRFSFHPLDYGCALAFFVYAAGAVFLPVSLMRLVAEFGFSLQAGGAVEVVRSTALMLTLGASGFLAARMGKVPALVLGLVLMGAGLALFAGSPVFSILLAASFLSGLGAGSVEALINPIVQDLHPGDSGRYLNFVNAFWSVGVVFGTMVTGDLLDRGVSWRPIGFGLAVLTLSAAAGFWVLRMSKPHNPVRQSEVWRSKAAILRHPLFFSFAVMMALTGLAEGGLTFWTASFVQLHFGLGPRAGGMATAVFAAGMIVSRIAWGFLIPQHSLQKALFFSMLFGLLPCLLLPLTRTPWQAFVLLFPAGLAIAPLWPVIQSLAAERIPRDATSLFILLSCAGIPGFALGAWLIGVLSDGVGIARALWIVPAAMAVLCGLFVERSRRSRLSTG